MKNLLIPTLALLLLVFVGCQKEKLESVHEQVQTGQVVPGGSITTRSAEVPFKANFKTTVVVTPVGNGFLFIIQANGEGKATHMGKTTQESTTTLDVSTTPWPNYGTENVWTAANGDKLFFSVDGYVNPPNEQGIYIYSYTWEITGGTGHFVGVTGSGTAVGTGNLEGQGEIFYDGTLEGL
jgi:hypothetical protein